MRLAVLTSTTILLCVVGCDTNRDAPAEDGIVKSEVPKPNDSVADEAAGADKSQPAVAEGAGRADDVDVEAARQAFGCDAPADAAAKRACTGLVAFEKAGEVSSYPVEGTTTFVARVDCVKQPHTLIKFSIAHLSSGGPPGDVEEAIRPPGVIKTHFESWARDDQSAESADRIIGDIRDGKPLSARTSEESSTVPESYSDWREKWALFKPGVLQTEQTAGKSLYQHPEAASLAAGYWREADGALVRVAPPKGEWGWCVSHYFKLPT